LSFYTSLLLSIEINVGECSISPEKSSKEITLEASVTLSDTVFLSLKRGSAKGYFNLFRYFRLVFMMVNMNVN
jgi:hypothetical protein